MNSTTNRPPPPAPSGFFRAAAAALVLLALMAGGAAAQQAASGEKSAAATKRLFDAVYDNNLGAVQTSIAAGADITATNEQGLLPVEVAVDRGHFQIAHFLLSIRNFRRTKQSEAPPPAPIIVAPPTPAVEAPTERPALTALSSATSSPPAQRPGEKPNPFDPAAQAAPSNITLAGPVLGPGTVPPVAQAPPPPTVIAPTSPAPAEASPAAAQATPEPQPARPGIFGLLTRPLRSDDKEPASPAGEAKMVEVARQPAVRASKEQTLPAASRPPSAPMLASRKPAAPRLPPTTAENPFDPGAAALGSALPVIGKIYGPGSSLPQPEPPPMVEAAPDPEPPVEVAEAPAAAPARTVSPAETEKAAESPGFLDRLKGFFGPAAESPPEAPTTPEAGRPMATKAITEAPPPAQAPAKTATAPSETASPVPQAVGATTEPTKPEPAKPADLFQRLSDFLKPEDTKATKVKAPAKKSVETAILLERPASAIPTPPSPRRLLEGVILTLGKTARLGGEPGKGTEQGGHRQSCLKKRGGALMFCIEPVDWPDEIGHHFDVDTYIYNGAQSIARYDDGEATSYFTLFKSESFDAVIAYYERRFGKPTEIWERRVKPLATAPRPNPIMLWRSADPATKSVSVLKVRKFDDTRGGFPDMRRGAIMLRREDAEPIFPRLSTLELMSVN